MKSREMKECMNKVFTSCETNFKKHNIHVIGVPKGGRGGGQNKYI